MASDPNISASFKGIQRFVVLMLENRSFDHLFGFMKGANSKIMGLTGDEFNQEIPGASPSIKVSRATSFMMRFDPGHEFYDVQIQLYGPLAHTAPDLPPIANPPSQPAPMTGFISSATQAVDSPGDETVIMECFQADQLPVLSALANEFAVFNFWHSSLPGPTWPNRFFIHAASSGGLTDSPSTDQILAGFSFQNGTIYDRLGAAGKSWSIYHDGLPQTAGIDSLRGEYINPFTKNFQAMDHFFTDVKDGKLADYNFLEPRYDTGNNYLDGNSMHPLNDIRRGEALVKQVYEALRNSAYWNDTMLVITFDEHGGFYDHVSPPATVAPGDAIKYANPAYAFSFQQLGVRVPAMVISAYTAKGTVIGDAAGDAATVFDHASLLATVEKFFEVAPLTHRDGQAKTLEMALNLATARTDAPTQLPEPAGDTAVTAAVQPANLFAAAARAPLSANQKTMAALALGCDLKITDPNLHAALISNHQKLVEQKDAADYIQKVEQKVLARRQATKGS